MAVSEQLKALVDQMPNPDGRGMFTENIDKEKIDKAVEAIYKGGPAFVQGLIDMLRACEAVLAGLEVDAQRCRDAVLPATGATDGDLLGFQWRFLTVPGGSAAVLSDPAQREAYEANQRFIDRNLNRCLHPDYKGDGSYEDKQEYKIGGNRVENKKTYYYQLVTTTAHETKRMVVVR